MENAVKIDRTKLLTQVDHRVAALESEKQAQYDKAKREYDEAFAGWQATRRIDLLAALDDMRKKLRAGKPVSREEAIVITGERYQEKSGLMFNVAEPDEANYRADRQIDRLKALREFLGMVTDEEVGEQILQRAGWKDLTGIFL